MIKDLPGVRHNLNDHPDFVLKYKYLQPFSLWPKTRPLVSIAAGLQWIFTRDGACASSHFEAVACIRSGAGVAYRDLQLTISPIAMEDETWTPIQEHAFQIHVGLMQAHSRGRVELQSTDPATAPRLLVNYLEDRRDRDLMRRGIRLVRELVDQPAFSGLRGEEILPGENAQSDEDLDHHLSAKTTTQWHLTGTARMGSGTDRGAVVDTHGHVHGIAGLRVVDALNRPWFAGGSQP